MFKFRTMRTAATGSTVLAVAALFALSGCSSVGQIGEAVGSLGGMLTPYRSDVLQGNVVTREQVQALQRGMPRDQVRNTILQLRGIDTYAEFAQRQFEAMERGLR